MTFLIYKLQFCISGPYSYVTSYDLTVCLPFSDNLSCCVFGCKCLKSGTISLIIPNLKKIVLKFTDISISCRLCCWHTWWNTCFDNPRQWIATIPEDVQKPFTPNWLSFDSSMACTFAIASISSWFYQTLVTAAHIEKSIDELKIRVWRIVESTTIIMTIKMCLDGIEKVMIIMLANFRNKFHHWLVKCMWDRVRLFNFMLTKTYQQHENDIDNCQISWL